MPEKRGAGAFLRGAFRHPAATLRQLRRSERAMELVRYVIIGAATTAVSYGVFALTVYGLHWNADAGDTVSIIAAVLFAYVANKLYVFRTHCSGFADLLREMGAFFASRAATMALEKGCNAVMFNVFHIEPIIAKIAVSVVVTVLNYVLSKHFAFRKRKDG